MKDINRILALARRAVHPGREALAECLTNLFLSTSPLWTSAIAVFLTKESNLALIPKLFWVFEQVLDKGILIIYCTAFIAPVYYIIHNNYLNEKKESKKFPASLIISLIILFINILIAIYYAFDYVQMIKLPNSLLLKISIYCFIGSLTLNLFVTFIRNSMTMAPPDIEKETRLLEEIHVQKFQERIKENDKNN